MAQTSYSRHAWTRVLDRLSLTPAELAALLDYDLAVSIGVRGRTLHRLFYSPPDQQCFVAIQDQDMGVVVTVLPLDYHESCAWAVSQAAQEEARNLLSKRPPFFFERESPKQGMGPSVFRVGCCFINGQGGLRSANLGSLPADPFDRQVAVLLENDAVLDDVRRRMHARRRLGEIVAYAFVRLGKNGPATKIDLFYPTDPAPESATLPGRLCDALG